MVAVNLSNAAQAAPSTEVEEKQYSVFFHHIPNAYYIFPDGSIAAFVGGRYVTDDPLKAACLLGECRSGNPHIHQKSGLEVMKESELDPMHELRKKIIAEYEAQKKAIAEGKADYGSYEQTGKINVADTSVIAEGAAGSDSPAAPVTSGIKPGK